MNPYTAVVEARQLGADVVEELEAFREALRVRREIKARLDILFEINGWK